MNPDSGGSGPANRDSLLRQASQRFHDLVLYVAGSSVRSLRAVDAVKELCERYLEGRYRLQVIDGYQEPEALAAAGIVALPTLVQKDPGSWRWLVGDLRDTAVVLEAMGIEAVNGI